MRKNLKDALQKSIAAETKSNELKYPNLDSRFNKADELFDSTESEIKQTNRITKVLKDTFTMPIEEYSLIEKCQNRLLSNQKVVNKSEIVRIALIVLDSLDNKALLDASYKVTKIKTGRPKQS